MNLAKNIILIFNLMLFIQCANKSTYLIHAEHNQCDSLLLSKEITTDLGDTLIIKFLHDNNSNLFIQVKNKDGYLWGCSGIGFSNINTDDTINLIRKYHFDRDSIAEYVIQSFVIGSTFGAQTLFVLWYDGEFWQITKANFSRAFVEDKNKDGIDEIIEYFHSKNNDGDIYRFNKGNFILLE